jgi:hypothetical protein
MSLGEGFAVVRNISTQIKAQVANTLLPGAQTAGLSAQVLIGIPQAWTNWQASLNQAAALTGITAYFQAQLNRTDDITVTIAALSTAMAAFVTAITSGIFSTSTAAGQYAVLNPTTGALTYTMFTPTQLAGLVPLLQALQAALD